MDFGFGWGVRGWDEGDVLELILWGDWGITVYFTFYVFTFLFSVLNFKSFCTHTEHSTRCFTVRKPFGECAAACARESKEGRGSAWDVAMWDNEDRQGTISRGWKGTKPWPGIWILAMQFPADGEGLGGPLSTAAHPPASGSPPQ